eukprot:8663394-Alexandrium_andersonii.AAC.1
MSHLDGTAELPAEHAAAAQRERLRVGLLGPLEDAWQQVPAGGPQGRVALLIDQSKAFERLAPAWLEEVMEWRRIPERWRRLVRAFVAPRLSLIHI